MTRKPFIIKLISIILIALVFFSQPAPLYALELGKDLCQAKLRPISPNEARDSSANGAGDIVESIENDLAPQPSEASINNLLERHDFLRRIATLLRLTERSGREWGFGVSRFGRLRSTSSGSYGMIVAKDGKGVLVHTHPLWGIDWLNPFFFLPSEADLRGTQSKEGIVAFGTRKFGYFLTIFDKEIVGQSGIGVNFSARKPQQLWEEIRRLSEMGGIRFYGLQSFKDGRKTGYRIRPIKPLRMKRIISHLIKERFAVERAMMDSMYEYFVSLPMPKLEEHQTYLLNRQARYAWAVQSGIRGREHTSLMMYYLYIVEEEIETLERAIFHIQKTAALKLLRSQQQDGVVKVFYGKTRKVLSAYMMTAKEAESAIRLGMIHAEEGRLYCEYGKAALLDHLAFQQSLRAGDASFGLGQGAGRPFDAVSDGNQAGYFWKDKVAVVMDASEASAQAIIRKLIAKGLADENIISFVSSPGVLEQRGIDLNTLEGVSRLKNLIQKEAGNREITLIINNMSPANPMLEDNLRFLGIVTMPDVLDDEAEWQRITQEAIASCV